MSPAWGSLFETQESQKTVFNNLLSRVDYWVAKR